MRSKIFFAAIAQPHAQDLGNLFPLGLREGFVKSERLSAFPAARSVAMRVPFAPRRADETTRFLDHGFP